MQRGRVAAVAEAAEAAAVAAEEAAAVAEAAAVGGVHAGNRLHNAERRIAELEDRVLELEVLGHTQHNFIRELHRRVGDISAEQAWWWRWWAAWSWPLRQMARRCGLRQEHRWLDV